MAKENPKQYHLSPLDNRYAKMRSLFNFFMYEAPGIDSSLASNLRADIDQPSIVNILVRDAKIQKDNIHICDRRSFKLNDSFVSEIDFNSRYIYCHKKKDEGKLSCILRHCRNSLAHGNIYIKMLKNNVLLCFVDYDRNHRLSAVIIINKASLARWERVIEQCSC